MAEKIFNTRILNKIDTLENWNQSTLKIKQGEICLCTVAASAGTGLTEPVVMAKIGTSEEKTFSELPWSFYAKASDVIEAAKSEAGLKTFINNVIAEAGIATSDALTALAGRVTTAEGEIDTLQSEMDAVEAKAAANETAIGTLQGLVGDESVAAQIQAKIDALNLATTYEAKGEAAKVQTALDTYKTSNDAAVQKNASDIAAEVARAKAAEEANANAITAIKDGTTIDSFADVEAALAGKETSGAADQALTDAKAYADGLAGNYDAKGSAAQALTDAKAYADGLAGNYDAAGSAADALADAKDYTDGEIAEWVGDKTVGVQISEAITGLDLANTYDAKGAAATAESNAKAYADGLAKNYDAAGAAAAVEEKLNTHKEEAAAAYETKTDAAAKLTEAKGYTDTEVAKVQGEVDDLETYVGTIPETAEATNIVAYIQEKTSGIATDTALEELTGRVADAESAIDAIEADYLKAADKTALQDQITANAGDITALEGLVGDTSVATQITDAVAVEKARAEAAEKVNSDAIAVLNGNTSVEGSVDKKVADAINEFATQMSDDDTVNTYKELINYAATHGAEFTELVGEVDANTKAIATLNGDASTAGSVAKQVADAIAAENLSQYATDSDLNGVDARLQAVESAVGETGSVATAIEEAVTEAKDYTDALAEGAVADNAAAIEVLEGKVGDKSVADQITSAVNDLKNGQLTTMQGEIDAVEDRATALEAKAHEHANKSVLDGITADQVTAWDAAVQTVTVGTGLTATKTGTEVAIDFDDSVTWVFDCGDSGVTAE